MINLVKNELSKIFSKKSTYVMFAIMLLFVIFTNVIYKTQLDENGNFKITSYNSNLLKRTKKELEELDTSDTSNKNYELLLRKNLMEYELYEKYGEYSWQAYFINSDLHNLISQLVNKKYETEKDEELLKELESEYNLYIDKFENDDWKYFVNKEIEEVNKELEELNNSEKIGELNEEFIKYKKTVNDAKLEVLNYRIENNVSYAHSYLNTAIDEYLDKFILIKSSDIDYIIEQNELLPKDGILYEYYNNLSTMYVNKYILDNKIDANKINDTRGILINLFTEYELLIIFIIIMFSAVIVANEFNKGTIKQLLLSPYTRTQILLSKYITCIIMILFTIFITILMQVLVGGIIFGLSSLSVPVVVYNFNNRMIETYNVFHYLLILISAKMPMILIIVTLVLLVETLTLNSVISIVMGIILYLATPFISQIALSSNIEFINFLVFLHWDFTQYLFGMISKNPYVTINISIIICILCFVLSFIPSYIIFNKKDIKNM